MHIHWEHKKKRPPEIGTRWIDEWCERARRNGALGRKLIGAGGGGVVMSYAEEHVRLRQAIRGAGFCEVRFRFDFNGSKVVAQS